MSWLNSQEKLTLVLVEKRILGILFCKKSIALLHLLHIAIVFWGVNYCILQYSIALLAGIAIANAIVLMAIANALNSIFEKKILIENHFLQNEKFETVLKRSNNKKKIILQK